MYPVRQFNKYNLLILLETLITIAHRSIVKCDKKMTVLFNRIDNIILIKLFLEHAEEQVYLSSNKDTII